MEQKSTIEIAQQEGEIIKIYPEEIGLSANGKEWRKFVFILETNGTKIACTVFNTCKQEKIIKPNQKVVLSFYPKSREYNGKWFTDIMVEGVRPIKEFIKRESNHADWM